MHYAHEGVEEVEEVGLCIYISHIEDVAEAVDGTYERRSERMRVGLIDLGGRTGAVRKIMTLPRVRA